MEKYMIQWEHQFLIFLIIKFDFFMVELRFSCINYEWLNFVLFSKNLLMISLK